MYDFRDKEVLIVEDNDINRDVFTSQLEKEGAKVFAASNGKEAVAAVISNAFDFVLMDAIMPVMDGFEATNEIRALGYTKPIIGISGHEPEYMTIGAQRNGMNDILEKPLVIEALREKLAGSEADDVPQMEKGKSLLILCAGQFGMITKEIAEAVGYEKIGFLDDYVPDVLGKLTEYRKFVTEYSDAIVAADSITLRMDYLEKLRIVGYHIPTLVHPTAFVSPSVKIGEGTIIQAKAAINTGCTIGKGCIISMSANINHHTKIGDYCHIACNSTVMQNTNVKPCTTTTIGQLFLIEPSIKR